MKKLALCVTFLLIAGGVFAADLMVTDTATGPAVIESQPDGQALSCEQSKADQPFEQAAEAFECPYGAPYCSPFNLEPCDEYCGVGWGDCYRFCCVCLG